METVEKRDELKTMGMEWVWSHKLGQKHSAKHMDFYYITLHYNVIKLDNLSYPFCLNVS